MKKITGLLLSFTLILGLAGCGQSSQTVNAEALDPETFYSEMIWCTAGADTRAQAIVYQRMADRIEEKTNGHITVKLYFNSQIGTDQEVIENIQRGRVHGNMSTTAAIPNVVPVAGLFDYPMLLDDMEVATDLFWDDDFLPLLRNAYSNHGLYLGAVLPGGFRWSLSDREIDSIDKFSGFNMRTGNNPYTMAYYRAVGASVTPLDFSEVSVSLQQGLINGLENPLNVLQPGNYHELAAYVVDTRLSMYCLNVLLSEDYMNSIPPVYKEAIDEAMKEVSYEAIDIFNEYDEKARGIMEADGAIFVELPDDMRQEMRERSSAAVEPMLRENLDGELIDAMVNTYNRIKAEKDAN